MRYAAGVDIGATSVKFGVVDETGALCYSKQLPTILGDPSAMLSLIEREIEAAPYALSGVGVGAPGSVRMPGGIVHSGNLKWVDVPFLDMMRARLPIPCWADNDAQTALAAEWRTGACQGLSTAVYLTLGTGIGGALLLDGKPWRGHDNRAGELGHIITHAGGLPCSCGRAGCFEMYASATALKRMAGGQSPQEVVEGAKAGDASMREILDQYAREVAIGLVGLHMVFRPQAIVLGGGLSKAGDILLNAIRDAAHALNLGAADDFAANIHYAIRQNDAGMIGAATLALQNAVSA